MARSAKLQQAQAVAFGGVGKSGSREAKALAWPGARSFSKRRRRKGGGRAAGPSVEAASCRFVRNRAGDEDQAFTTEVATDAKSRRWALGDGRWSRRRRSAPLAGFPTKRQDAASTSRAAEARKSGSQEVGKSGSLEVGRSKRWHGPEREASASAGGGRAAEGQRGRGQVWARRPAVARASGSGPRLRRTPRQDAVATLLFHPAPIPPRALDSPPSIPRPTARCRGHFSHLSARSRGEARRSAPLAGFPTKRQDAASTSGAAEARKSGSREVGRSGSREVKALAWPGARSFSKRRRRKGGGRAAGPSVEAASCRFVRNRAGDEDQAFTTEVATDAKSRRWALGDGRWSRRRRSAPLAGFPTKRQDAASTSRAAEARKSGSQEVGKSGSLEVGRSKRWHGPEREASASAGGGRAAEGQRGRGQVWARRPAVARASGSGPRLRRTPRQDAVATLLFHPAPIPPRALDSPPSIPRPTARCRGHFSHLSARSRGEARRSAPLAGFPTKRQDAASTSRAAEARKSGSREVGRSGSREVKALAWPGARSFSKRRRRKGGGRAAGPGPSIGVGMRIELTPPSEPDVRISRIRLSG
jgi:hypothetical protein